jgi:DNA-3-methyladenine glycosylase
MPAARRGRRLGRRFYQRDSAELAPLLLNKLLVRGDGRAARLVEVEAYRGAHDPASHAYRGRTARNEVMFGPAGHLYVYFTYGMHWCANVVCGPEGVAQAVLLRAAEPVRGVDAMRLARWNGVAGPSRRDRDLCRGPARLCQALGVDRALGGADLVVGASGIWLADDGTPPPATPSIGPRVGVVAGADLPWRFSVPGHPSVSAWRSGGPVAPPPPVG